MASSRPFDPVTGLTGQQEAFAQAVAAHYLAGKPGLGYSDAHSLAYHHAPDTLPGTIYTEASLLASSPKVAQRIQQIKDQAQAQLAKKQAWNLERFLNQAEKHIDIALFDYPKRGPNVSAANGALEMIGRASGVLKDKPVEVQPVIRRVVVVLHHGARRDGPGVVEMEMLSEPGGTPGVADSVEAPQNES